MNSPFTLFLQCENATFKLEFIGICRLLRITQKKKKKKPNSIERGGG